MINISNNEVKDVGCSFYDDEEENLNKSLNTNHFKERNNFLLKNIGPF